MSFKDAHFHHVVLFTCLKCRVFCSFLNCNNTACTTTTNNITTANTNAKTPVTMASALRADGAVVTESEYPALGLTQTLTRMVSGVQQVTVLGRPSELNNCVVGGAMEFNSIMLSLLQLFLLLRVDVPSLLRQFVVLRTSTHCHTRASWSNLNSLTLTPPFISTHAH